LLGSSQFNYTIQACQERETSKLTFSLLLQTPPISVPMHNQGADRTPPTPTSIGMVHMFPISGQNYHSRYTEFRKTRAYQINLGMINGYELHICIYVTSWNSMIKDQVINALNIMWKLGYSKTITADDNRSHMTLVTEFGPVSSPALIISVHSICVNPDHNEISWVAPRKHTLQFVRRSWMITVVRLPCQPSMGHGRRCLFLQFLETIVIKLPQGREIENPI
jgi:hypothetical protein